MGAENVSSMDDFLIMGFSDLPLLQVPLFVAFLLTYLITVAGNLLIMVTVYFNSHLHTPMYFFLTKLSFIDICYTSALFPQMLAGFFQEALHISMTKCLLQIYFFMALLATEFELLAIMAYDRYVAICNPLRYMAIMTKRLCMQLAAGSWAVASMVPVGHTLLISKLSFCHTHILNHFFCEIATLLKMSCTSTQSIESLSFIIGTLLTVPSFSLIITSYVKITLSVLKIKIKGGRQKAFSTCASHLTVVILFYVSLCSSYMRPASTYSMKGNKIVSLAYITITPLCNPFIYSLNNAEFKKILKKRKNTPVEILKKRKNTPVEILKKRKNTPVVK